MTNDNGTRLRGIKTFTFNVSRPVLTARWNPLPSSSSANNRMEPEFAATLSPVARNPRRVCIASPRPYKLREFNV
ncbi:hypothetical protein N9B98_03930, partial [bacterium]|nr:hypothetical protein [bacterium]